MTACPPGFPLQAPFLANVLVRRFAARGTPVNQAQLQKVLYLAHGHLLGRFGVHLATELPRADGAYGPLYSDVRLGLIGQGNRALRTPPFPEWASDLAALHRNGWTDATTDAFLDAIVSGYAGWSALRLSELVHVADDPWRCSHDAGLTWVDEARMRTYFEGLTQRVQANRQAA